MFFNIRTKIFQLANPELSICYNLQESQKNRSHKVEKVL